MDTSYLDWNTAAYIAELTTHQEVFDNDHRVVNQKGSHSGRFTFSAADSGDHKICFTPSSTAVNNGWLSGLTPLGGVRLTLDLAIGETSQIESTDKGKIQDIVKRVKDLNGRLQDIRREQVFQRVCSVVPIISLFRYTTYLAILPGPLPTCLSASSISIFEKYILTSIPTGTRSRVQRSIRNHQRASRSMDTGTTSRPGHHLRLAIVTSEILLHQAEVDVSATSQHE